MANSNAVVCNLFSDSSLTCSNLFKEFLGMFWNGLYLSHKYGEKAKYLY